MSNRDIVVIGGSAGAAQVVSRLLGELPADLPAAFLLTLHLDPANEEWLSDRLAKLTSMPVISPVERQPIHKSTLYVAPPDRHLIVKQGWLQTSRGPRENLWRPAIDVLFRSAAVAYGSRVIGILLTGELDDGTAGLQAIKTCGGLALVQEPRDALYPTMPRTAAANVSIDHYVTIDSMAAVLSTLIRQPAPRSPSVPLELSREALIAEGIESYATFDADPGPPSSFTCPECSGPLWQRGADGAQFRCLVGHSFRVDSLFQGTDDSLDRTLWAAIRMFEQRGNIARMMMEQERARGRTARAEIYRARAAESHEYALRLRELQRHHGGVAHATQADLAGNQPPEPENRTGTDT